MRPRRRSLETTQVLRSENQREFTLAHRPAMPAERVQPGFAHAPCESVRTNAGDHTSSQVLAMARAGQRRRFPGSGEPATFACDNAVGSMAHPRGG